MPSLWVAFLTSYVSHRDYVRTVSVVRPLVFLAHLFYASTTGIVKFVSIGVEDVICSYWN